MFLRENHLQRNLISFRLPKLTLNFWNSLFLLTYFKILEVVRDEITIKGWSVFKTSPLVEWAIFFSNLSRTLTCRYIIVFSIVSPFYFISKLVHMTFDDPLKRAMNEKTAQSANIIVSLTREMSWSAWRLVTTSISLQTWLLILVVQKI